MSYVDLAYINEAIGLKSGEYMALGFMLRDLKAAEPFAARLYTSMAGMGIHLFERSAGEEGTATTPFQAMMRAQRTEDWEGSRYSVYTIDDIVSQAKQIVVALDGASLVILLVLFAIVMIGINNTFRMVMYERIKEIGTMRALGVQRKEIKSLFLNEALFLAIGGAVSGIVLALIAMSLLSLIDFGMNTPAFMIMKNGHLAFFVPPLRAVFNVVIIAKLTLLAAYFPAKAAAKMEPAVALRPAK